MYVRWNVQKVLNVMHCNVARNVGAAKHAHQLWRREQLYMLLDHCKKLTNMCHFRITLSISWSQVSLIHLYVMHNTKKKGSVHLGNCSNTIFGRNSGQGPPMFFYTRDVSLARAAFKDSFRLVQLFGSLSHSLSSISFLARFFFVYLLNDTSIIQRKTR